MKKIMGFIIPQSPVSALIESTELVMKLQVENARLRAALEKLACLGNCIAQEALKGLT